MQFADYLWEIDEIAIIMENKEYILSKWEDHGENYIKYCKNNGMDYETKEELEEEIQQDDYENEVYDEQIY